MYSGRVFDIDKANVYAANVLASTNCVYRSVVCNSMACHGVLIRTELEYNIVAITSVVGVS